MPQGQTLRIEGYKEFLIACDNAGRQSKKYVRETFRSVGDIVRSDAAQRLAPLSFFSAAGYRTVVRQRGVVVEQRLRKVTGLRPDWGETQMREALLPSMTANEERVTASMEEAIGKVCDHFERTP